MAPLRFIRALALGARDASREDPALPILVTLLLLAVVGWYAFWVVPHDRFMGEVMDCMQDNSQVEYTRCAAEVRR